MFAVPAILLVACVAAVLGIYVRSLKRSSGAGVKSKYNMTSAVEFRALPSEYPKVVIKPLLSEQRSTPLQALFQQLEEAFAAEKLLVGTLSRHQDEESISRLCTRVASLVQSYVRGGHSDWQEYLEFNPHHYVRHLVDSNQDFEMMLLCWQPGQASRVHDHDDSHCWVTCLQGSAVEERYRARPKGGAPETGMQRRNSSQGDVPGIISMSYPCPTLEVVGEQVITLGDTGYLNDNIALHAVSIPEDVPPPGTVTLHIYSPPIRRVKLYEPESNRVVARRPGFWTIRGVRQ